MKEFDLSHISEVPDEIEGVPRVQTETDNKPVMKKLSVERLTTITFMLICFVIFLFAIRVISHSRIMKGYAIPENAIISENASENNQNNEETDYVNEVVYNPSELGKKLAKLQNDFSAAGDDLMGEPLWYSGKSDCNYKWKFMSGYDYRSAKIECIWICKDVDTGKILAFHTAVYNGGTNKFENGITKVTEEGVENRAVD